jgi:hypothetical protein
MPEPSSRGAAKPKKKISAASTRKAAPAATAKKAEPKTSSAAAATTGRASTDARSVPGPDAIAGAVLTTQALQRSRVDPDAAAPVITALGDLLPGKPIRAGAAAQARTIPASALTSLIPSAAVVASGLDPAKTSLPVPAVVWTSGANTLLVRPGQVKATLGSGTIDLTVPVSCDQTGDTEVTVTFVTGTPDRPTGGIVTTEDHPRGAPVIVENWTEPLVAYAWRTLVAATDALSGAAGGDFAGADLITAGLTTTSDGLGVTPMGRHAFLAGGLTT